MKTLDRKPDKIRFRSPISHAGLLIAVVAFVACSILVSGFHMSFATFPPLLLACIGVSGIMLMLATYRKVEFVRFKNDSGIVVLDIARSAKKATLADSFIDALTTQIAVARGEA